MARNEFWTFGETATEVVNAYEVFSNTGAQNVSNGQELKKKKKKKGCGGVWGWEGFACPNDCFGHLIQCTNRFCKKKKKKKISLKAYFLETEG